MESVASIAGTSSRSVARRPTSGPVELVHTVPWAVHPPLGPTARPARVTPSISPQIHRATSAHSRARRAALVAVAHRTGFARASPTRPYKMTEPSRLHRPYCCSDFCTGHIVDTDSRRRHHSSLGRSSPHHHSAGRPAAGSTNDPQYRSRGHGPRLAREDRVQARAGLLPNLNYNNSFIYTQGTGALPSTARRYAGCPTSRFIANNGVHEYISQADVHRVSLAYQCRGLSPLLRGPGAGPSQSRDRRPRLGRHRDPVVLRIGRGPA